MLSKGSKSKSVALSLIRDKESLNSGHGGWEFWTCRVGVLGTEGSGLLRVWVLDTEGGSSGLLRVWVLDMGDGSSGLRAW